ncbi:hypothetical protein PVAND_016377 [Polypedilum vanderplanki]|uniref:Uncharacterized protein n=1 Tax=Polypedilum vanderplanki TaxID=319348 RepID=A0A9J6BF97_POLVA|nr:hypothetical protein PVAND_016377 [Polypedilum vanderplanki]
MKVAIIFVLIAVVTAAPADKKKSDSGSDPNSIQVLKEYTDIVEGGYKFGFEQSDGQKRDETGEVKTIGSEQGIVMRGSYEFVADDGNTYRVDYVADENGFQPTGAHLVGVESGKQK